MIQRILLAVVLAVIYLPLAVVMADSASSNAAPNRVTALQLRDAYLMAAKAEGALGAGQSSEALTGFTNAFALFQQIHEAYPDWQPELVNRRMSEIGDVVRRLGAGAPGDKAASDDRIRRLIRDMEQVRILLAVTGETHDPSNSEEIGELRERVQRLEEVNAALQRSNRLLVDETARLDARLAKRDKRGEPRPSADLVASVLRREAQQLEQQQQSATAIALLGEACLLMPDSTEMAMAFAFTRMRGGKFAEARDTLLALADRTRTNATVYAALGSAYMGNTELSNARDAFEKAISLNPGMGDAHYNLAILYMERDPPDPANAEREYMRAIQAGAAPDPALSSAIRDLSIIKAMKQQKKAHAAAGR
ncbi:MAG: hypothetical protein WCL16_04525 [bacterium]